MTDLHLFIWVRDKGWDDYRPNAGDFVTDLCYEDSCASKKASVVVSDMELAEAFLEQATQTCAQTCFKGIASDLVDRAGEGDAEEEAVVDTVISAQEVFQERAAQVACEEQSPKESIGAVKVIDINDQI